jgi:hypothetical protein
MTPTRWIIRTLLLTSFVLCWTIDVKPRTEDKPNGSTVRGVVVYSDTGRPLRHARVTLFRVDSKTLMNTASDLRGRFEFEDVQEGEYRLTVEAPGLLTPYGNVVRARTIVEKPRFPDIDELITRVTVNGVDSIDLKIKSVRGGVITGRVVNDDDQPVQHAEIRLLRREKGKWVPLWSTWTMHHEDAQRADATGVYRIAGLPSGDYLVRASEPSLADDFVPGDEDAYSNGSFFVAYYPAATRLKDAKLVSVTTGNETTNIDIRMTQQAPHTLSGTLKSELLGKPGSSFAITVERSDEAGFSTAIQNSTAGVNPEGKWEVVGLPAGEYVVTMVGSAITVNDGNVEFERTLPKRITVKLQDQKVTILDTTLTLGARVAGTVMLNGKPLARESSLTAAVKPVEDPGGANDTTDQSDNPSFAIGLVHANGKFSIAPLLPGTYWFEFFLRKPDEFYVKSVTRKGIDLMQAPFKLADDVLFDDVVVTLATDLASVEGQLMLPEAEQLTGGNVTVVMAPANELTNRFNPGTRTLPAGAKGKIAVRSPPGEYLIAAFMTADYGTIAAQFNNEYFAKSADKFLRVKLSAGEKINDLRVPMLKK